MHALLLLHSTLLLQADRAVFTLMAGGEEGIAKGTVRSVWTYEVWYW
jgi:hypothetical protein